MFIRIVKPKNKIEESIQHSVVSNNYLQVSATEGQVGIRTVLVHL